MLIPILVVVSALAAAAQERFVKPVDTAKQDASFVVFREQLIKAAESRDGAFVLNILDPKIMLSYGGDAGTRDFRRMWKPESRDSPLWDELLAILRNGGKFDKKEFYAPYVFVGWPEDLGDTDYQAIVGSGVNLREAPSTNARVVGQLSYNVVKVDYEKSVKKSEKEPVTYEWLRVETLGGKRGYVKSEFVRSPLGYRAAFAKKAGKWRMTFLIAGD